MANEQKKRLVGRNGRVMTFTIGQPVQGDGETTLQKGVYYVINAMGATSAFTNGQVGMVIVGNGTLAPLEGDSYSELTITGECDARQASVEFEAEEIDITTLCDDIMKYATGFVDLSGSIEGIVTIGLSEKFFNKFLPIVEQDATGDITVTPQNDDVLLLDVVFNKLDNTDIPKLEFIAPIVITTFSAGVQIGDAQTFESNFRIAQDNDINVQLLKTAKGLHN